MSLELHRAKEDLGGLVYLLTIDMSGVTGDPSHVRRFINNYGENGEGVTYQGNKYTPFPYEIKQVQRSAKNNSKGSKITIGDGDDYRLSRFRDLVGGSLQDGRVIELKVFGRFLDNQPDANSLAYVKRLDHTIDYVEDSDVAEEYIIHTIDPLSKATDVPTLSFTAGEVNTDVSRINIFPAVDRNINKDRG